MAQATLIFITGGVRSGKSTFAEQLATKEASRLHGGQLHYIACGQPVDGEMAARIHRHQCERQNNLIPWRTWECATHIQQLANQFTKNDIVLLDCLTTLLSNELFEMKDNWQHIKIQNKLKNRLLFDIGKLANHAGMIIIVSNELLNEPIMSGTFTAMYAKLLGQLHQAIVQVADQAFVVEMGIPILMKGATRNEGESFDRCNDPRNGVERW